MRAFLPGADGTRQCLILCCFSACPLGAVEGVSQTHVPLRHIHVFVFFFPPSPQFQLQMFDIVCNLAWTSRDRCCDLPSRVRENPDLHKAFEPNIFSMCPLWHVVAPLASNRQLSDDDKLALASTPDNQLCWGVSPPNVYWD